MSTITFPSMGFVSSQWGIQYNTQTFVSPLNGATQVRYLPGAKWKADYTTRVYEHNTDKCQEIIAFLSQLQGRFNDFAAYDPDYTGPRGSFDSGTSTPLVNGSSQTGNSLAVDGLATSQTAILKPGDYFTVNSELHRINASIDSDASGTATLTFDPPLKDSPSDNATVDVPDTATILMRLDSDSQSIFSTEQKKLVQFNFSATERLDV